MSTALVIDSSALVELVARTDRAPAVDGAIADRDLLAPDLVNPEVLSVLRRWRAAALLTGRDAESAVRALVMAPVVRYPTDLLLHSMWALRHVVTTYDAAYVALARWTGRPLLTADARLGRAPGLGVELLQV